VSDALVNIRRAFGLVWQAHWPSSLAMGGSTLVGALLPAGQAWVGKLIVDAVVNAINTHTGAPAGLQAVLPLLIAEFVMLVLQAANGQARTLAEHVLHARIVLSINTSAISYDFEQAKKPGRTGWATRSITNSLLSDLLPQFTLSLTHDLWAGEVGVDTSRFDPFLSSVSASFAISGNTLRSIGSIFGLGGKADARPARDEVPGQQAGGQRRRATSFYNTSQLPFSPGGRSFSANFDYTLSRTRPGPSVIEKNQQSLRFNTSFSPTPFWSLSWASLYNITDSKFESQSVRLERELHEWRAGFDFVRNANGNFAFYFSIYLTDLPDLKFDYNQATFER